jgi:hypothetical protein
MLFHSTRLLVPTMVTFDDCFVYDDTVNLKSSKRRLQKPADGGTCG